MTEDVQLVFEMTRERMEKALEHLDTELNRIRAGKANIHILDGIMVDYYGVMTPLNQVSNISTPDAKTIAIQPWEKNMIDKIERAIQQANIGITPMNNGELIRLGIPTLTEERRVSLVKQVKNEGENARISIRNARRDANEEYKQMQKDGLSEDDVKRAEDNIQEITKEFSEKVDTIIEAKEEDIMTI
ncbi:MAG: ribosome recycling factor [Bacteroidales bacterium]|nr:ribosome recycling factor [Bacteroidales bacterium]